MKFENEWNWEAWAAAIHGSKGKLETAAAAALTAFTSDGEWWWWWFRWCKWFKLCLLDVNKDDDEDKDDDDTLLWCWWWWWLLREAFDGDDELDDIDVCCCCWWWWFCCCCCWIWLFLRLARGKSGFTRSEVCSAFSWRRHLARLFWNQTWTRTSGKLILMASSSRLYTSG